MCVIMHGVKVNFLKAELEQAMKTNSEGFALLDVDANSITRSLDTKQIIAAFDSIPDNHHIVFHARIKTQGSATVANCHGWEKDGVYFFHNGILRDVPSKIDSLEEYKDASDSRIFFELYFMPIYHSQHDTFNEIVNGFVDMIRGASEYNRMIFVDKDKTIHSFGGFTEDHGIYASNSSYKVFAAEPVVTGGYWNVPSENACGVHVPTQSSFDDMEDEGYDETWRDTPPVYHYQGYKKSAKRRLLTFPKKDAFFTGDLSFPWFTEDMFNAIDDTVSEIIRNKKKINSLISTLQKNRVLSSMLTFNKKESLYGVPKAVLDVRTAKGLAKVLRSLEDLSVIFCNNLEESPYKYLANQLESVILFGTQKAKKPVEAKKEIICGTNHHVLPA